jgi:hypothetical protein
VPPEAYCDDLLAVHEQEVSRTPRTAIGNQYRGSYHLFIAVHELAVRGVRAPLVAPNTGGVNQSLSQYSSSHSVSSQSSTHGGARARGGPHAAHRFL